MRSVRCSAASSTPPGENTPRTIRLVALPRSFGPTTDMTTLSTANASTRIMRRRSGRSHEMSRRVELRKSFDFSTGMVAMPMRGPTAARDSAAGERWGMAFPLMRPPRR